MACGAILARCRQTLVDVILTVPASEAIHTHTHVVPDAVNTRPAILTGIWLAIVSVLLAVTSSVTVHTETDVRSISVGTRGAVKTRVLFTLIDILLTVAPCKYNTIFKVGSRITHHYVVFMDMLQSIVTYR